MSLAIKFCMVFGCYLHCIKCCNIIGFRAYVKAAEHISSGFQSMHAVIEYIIIDSFTSLEDISVFNLKPDVAAWCCGKVDTMYPLLILLILLLPSPFFSPSLVSCVKKRRHRQTLNEKFLSGSGFLLAQALLLNPNPHNTHRKFYA